MADGNLDPISLNIMKYIGVNLLLQHVQELVNNYTEPRVKKEHPKLFSLYTRLTKAMKLEAGVTNMHDSSNPIFDNMGEDQADIFQYMLEDGDNLKISMPLANIISPLDDKDEFVIFKEVANAIKVSLNNSNDLGRSWKR